MRREKDGQSNGRMKLVHPLSGEDLAAHEREIVRETRDISSLRIESAVSRLKDRGFSQFFFDKILAGDTTETPSITAMKNRTKGKRIVVLSGGVGCGKTHASHWFVLDRIRRIAAARAEHFRFIYSTDLVDMIINEQRLSFRSGVLVLDDLGAEHFKGEYSFFQSAINGIILPRFDSGRLTIITTNLCGKEGGQAFLDRYGMRLADRIREGGAWLNVDGESLRSRRSK